MMGDSLVDLSDLTELGKLTAKLYNRLNRLHITKAGVAGSEQSTIIDIIVAC